MTADEIDSLERRIMLNVYQKHGVIMSAIGIYSRNTVDDDVKEIRTRLTHLIMSHEGVLQIHGFYVDQTRKIITCDVILDYELRDREQLFARISREAQEAFPEYQVMLAMDIDL